MRGTHYRPYYTATGANLRYQRQRRGITQSEIADHLCMTRQRYSRIERDPKKAPLAMQAKINDFVMRDGYKAYRKRQKEMYGDGTYDFYSKPDQDDQEE